jgi:hypothetical protein
MLHRWVSTGCLEAWQLPTWQGLQHGLRKNRTRGVGRWVPTGWAGAQVLMAWPGGTTGNPATRGRNSDAGAEPEGDFLLSSRCASSQQRRLGEKGTGLLGRGACTPDTVSDRTKQGQPGAAHEVLYMCCEWLTTPQQMWQQPEGRPGSPVQHSLAQQLPASTEWSCMTAGVGSCCSSGPPLASG